MDKKQYLEIKNKLTENLRSLRDKKDAEKREFTKDEVNEIMEISNKLDENESTYNTEQAKSKVSTILDEAKRSFGRKSGIVDVGFTDQAEYRKRYDEAFRNPKKADFRALTDLTTGAQPGSLYIPVEYQRGIRERMDDVSVLLKLAEVVTMGADTKILVETSIGEAEQVAENGTLAGTGSTAQATQYTMQSYKFVHLAKASEELLSDAFFDVGAYHTRTFGRVFGLSIENKGFNGNGSGTITGILKDLNDNGRTIHSSSADGFTLDDLKDLHCTLPSQYLANATYVVSPTAMATIFKLKDDNNRPLWNPPTAGFPATLNGNPIFISSKLPGVSNGNIPVVFGDFREVMIALRGQMQVQMLTELYAANGMIGFRGVQRFDIRLLQNDAMVGLEITGS